jgi:hypothetical protein
VDRVAELDRAAIRASVIDRFSAARMADGYEAVYAKMLGLDDGDDDAPAPATAVGPGSTEHTRSAVTPREAAPAS